MRQFFQAPPATFDSLRERCHRSCIRYRGQELPSTCFPARADIGFEILAPAGVARLYVERGVDYRGDRPDLRDWLRAGYRDFADFESLVRWIQESLREEFQAHAAVSETPLGSALSATSPVPRPLNDFTALRSQMRARVASPPPLDPVELFQRLARRVRGQEHAIRSLAAVVARHSARREPKRPAVLFAVGPSGVGKTQSAETLATTLGELAPEGEGYRFLRLDMTEYQESHRVSQLLGAPQGYVGHEEGSQLLDTLGKSPRTVVLFDEIEKAHPSILRVLMNAMDAGRLSRPSRGESGHLVDCRRAIFLFTSNLDAKTILDELARRNGFGDRAIEDEVCRSRLHAAGIAAEIVGRIGRFLVFRHLDEDVRAEILALSIAEAAAEYGISVGYVEPGTVIALLSEIPNLSFGARPDQYLVDELLGDSFARAAASGLDTAWKVAGPPFCCVPFEQESRRETVAGLH